MTAHYKATRPDGTDFRTGTIDYARIGAVIEHPRTKRYGDMKPDDPGTYISVSVEPGEVLIGGHWPCRLFLVKPVGHTVRRGGYPHKRGCRAIRIVEEVSAHLALGPNGEAVAALIERAWRLTGDERDAAWDAAWDAALALLTRDLITPEQFDTLYGP